MRPSTTPCQSPNADALNGRHGFPPHIRASAGAGFGTGLCAAPFRQRPGICRCKARPSHINVSCSCIRAVLACPLSVDRDGFLSLSLSLTEGNAPPFGPIRGRQRLEIPRSIAPAQGVLCRGIRFPPRCRPDRRQGPGGPFPRIFSGRTPDTRQNSCGTLDQEPKRPPRQAAEVPHRQQGGIRLGVSPHGNAAKATASSCRHFPRLAGVPRQAAEARSCRTGHAAQRIPLRYAAKAAISAGHPPVIDIPPRQAALVAHVLT